MKEERRQSPLSALILVVSAPPRACNKTRKNTTVTTKSLGRPSVCTSKALISGETRKIKPTGNRKRQTAAAAPLLRDSLPLPPFLHLLTNRSSSPAASLAAAPGWFPATSGFEGRALTQNIETPKDEPMMGQRQTGPTQRLNSFILAFSAITSCSCFVATRVSLSVLPLIVLTCVPLLLFHGRLGCSSSFLFKSLLSEV